MTLEKLLKEVEQVKVTADIDPYAPKYRLTRSGMETAVIQAKARLAELMTDYKNALMNNGVGIFVLGSADKVGEFVHMAQTMDEGVPLALDVDDLYRPIANSVLGAVGRKGVFTLDQTLMVQKYVFDLVQEKKLPVRQGVILTNDLPPQQGITCYEDAFVIVRKLIRDSFGDILNTELMKDDLVKNALLLRYNGSSVPILIRNIHQDEIVSIGSLFLKGRGQIDIEENDAITQEYVTRQLKNVVKQIKAKKL